MLTGYLIWSTFTGEPSAFWAGIVILALGLAAYPVCRRWLKADRPEAEVDLTNVELGPRRHATVSRSVGS